MSMVCKLKELMLMIRYGPDSFWASWRRGSVGGGVRRRRGPPAEGSAGAEGVRRRGQGVRRRRGSAGADMGSAGAEGVRRAPAEGVWMMCPLR